MSRKDITLKGLKMQATANAEEDDDYAWWDTLDEIVITGSSSGTNYIDIPYVFNRNTSWGSGYQDTSYDNSPSWDFGSGGGYRPPSGNQIFSDELTGKADCVYGKMVDNNNNINWILKNFKDGDKPSEFDLKFIMSIKLDYKTNAKTHRYGHTIYIEINKNRAENINTVLTIARTIIHKGIHARLMEFASRKGSDTTSFPEGL